MSTEVSIKLGEMGPDFAKRYPDLVKIQHQPAGVDFYEVHWNQRSPGLVRIENGTHTFVVEYALSVQSMQDLGALAQEGLNEFDINFGITDPDLISHDEARLKFFELLRSIKQKGWRPVVERSDPRLSGKARFDYMVSVDDTIGLDPDYLPTFEEWMRLESRTTWPFYIDHAYLEVTFTREPTLTDPHKPGSYLISINIKTEDEYFRGYAGPENRDKWKEVVPGVLKQVTAERQKKEQALKASGVTIDEAYQDPPIPDFK